MSALEVIYFGIGDNADPDMVREITGNKHIKVGNHVLVTGVCLAVQKLIQTPVEPIAPGAPSANEVLSSAWTKNGVQQTFVNQLREGGEAQGRSFTLSEEDLAAIWNWQLVDLGWNTPTTVRALDLKTGYWIDGVTECLSGKQVTEAAAINSEPFSINEKEIMLGAAKTVFQAFQSGY